MADQEYFNFKNIVRDEYESELYGFPLRDFTKENYEFVESKINKSVKDLENHFISLVKDEKPELHDKIRILGQSVGKEVFQSCQLNIKKVNDVIIEKFSIPDNVLLLQDHVHAKDLEPGTDQELRDEIERLTNIANENAFFILSLNQELASLNKLEQATEEDLVFSKVEEQLTNVFNLELPFNILNKIKDMPKME